MTAPQPTSPPHSTAPSGTAETLPADELPDRAMSGSADEVPIVDDNRYVLGAEIAQGGIGRILRAVDERLRRPVALKELLDPSPEHEARFLREALVTAKLQHPAIVPVYDVGRFPNGEIFYAMKLVTGRSLGEVVDEANTLDKRLALLPHVIAVAEAIAYAHSERIVHRDLKPANVLIGPFGETVVIDWGIAKDLREIESAQEARRSSLFPETPPDSSSSLTMAGAVLGTPAYMPPEQAAGEPVDERADVYSLGAILYHLLAGAAPYEGKSGFDVLSKVLVEDPPPLSKRERGVPPDLLAVVNKAMAREPARRYPTANEFAHDLRRFQTGQIVGAYHYSRRERAIRFVQRHRAVMATTALGLIVTCVVAFTSLSRVFEARRVAEIERDRANEERARAQEKQIEAEAARLKTMLQSDELMLLQARAAARRDPNEAIAWLSSLGSSFQRWGEARLIAADARAYGIAKVLRHHTGALNTATYSPDGKIIVTASDDRTIGVWSSDGKFIRALEGHTDEVWRLDFTADGKRLLSNGKDGTVRVWDVATGQPLHVIRSAGPEAFWAVFVEQGKRVAFTDCTDKRIKIHHLETNATETLPGVIQCPTHLTISTDGQSIAYVPEGSVRVVDLRTGRFKDYESKEKACMFAFLSPDSQHVACVGKDSYVLLWDAKTGRLRKEQQFVAGTVPASAQFSHDGQRFLYTRNEQFHVMDLKTEAIQSFRNRRSPITMIWFSPTDRYIVTTGPDHTAGLCNLATGTEKTHFGFLDHTSWASFAPGEASFVVGSWDHNARIFPIDTLRDRILVKSKSPIVSARVSADERSVLAVDQDGKLHIAPLDGKGDIEPRASFTGQIHQVSPNGQKLAFGTKDGTVHVLPIDNLANEIQLVGHEGPKVRFLFSPDGKQLATLDQGNRGRLWDLATIQSRELFAHPSKPTAGEFSRDGQWLAVGEANGTVTVFPQRGGEPRRLEGHAGVVTALHFLPDGKRLVSGGKDHTIRIWDLSTGTSRTIDASGTGIDQIIATRDGKTIYSIGGEASIRHWDVETGKALKVLRGHTAPAKYMALSPDESRLVASSVAGTIRLWDLASGQSRSLDGHRGVVEWLSFSSSGDRIISAGVDGTVRIWYDDLPFDADALRAWMSNAVPEKMTAQASEN